MGIRGRKLRKSAMVDLAMDDCSDSEPTFKSEPAAGERQLRTAQGTAAVVCRRTFNGLREEEGVGG